MDKKFAEEYRQVKNEALLKANAYFFDHMDEITDIFRSALTSACENIRVMQGKGYQPIEYLEVTLLRTRVTQHDYTAPIMTYGSSWFADTAQIQAGGVDVGCIFTFYEDMIQSASKLIKKYQTKLPEQIMESLMCAGAEHFWNYAAMACHRAVKGFSPEGMLITEEFKIRCCEYMGYGQVCWRYTPEITQEQLKKWFDKKETDVYRFRDYRGRDFTRWDFAGMDLTGCDFRDCNLEGCDFEGADLTGTWFCNSNMREACLSGAWMPGTRFDNVDLRDAVLESAYSVSVINDDLWMRPDNLRASFAGADLRNADFTFSAIDHADFTGAVMDGVLLNDSHEGYYKLDEEQKKRVQFGDPEDEE